MCFKGRIQTSFSDMKNVILNQVKLLRKHTKTAKYLLFNLIKK